MQHLNTYTPARKGRKTPEEGQIWLLCGFCVEIRQQVETRSSGAAPAYAETLLGSIRRNGLAPGIGNCMCQKFVSGELNSTPTYCLPSRARWMETTRHSTDWVVWSFNRMSVCPTNRISSS